MHDLIKLPLIAAASVVSLFIIAKLLGKKQISQLDFIDYVMGISIGSIAAEMATDLEDYPFYYYIIAMLVFFLFDVLITFLGKKGTKFKHFIKGNPMVIIYEGKIDYEMFIKSKLDINDLLQLLRELGYFDLKDIAYAVFENSGKLSVLPVGSKRPTVAEDLSIPLEKSVLPNHIIVDGKLSYSGLNELDKTKEWLFERLNINSEKELLKILLSSYDSKTDTFETHYKN